MEWNDLRDILVIAEAGSLAGAARKLGVNHSTIFRRLGSIEQRLGTRLFERLPSGYVPTSAGEEMAAEARRMAQGIEALQRRLTGRDLALSGHITVTTTDTHAGLFLGPHLANFAKVYPAIGLTLRVDTQLANLARRDADVAIRPTNAPPETLVGRRVAREAFAAYAAPNYLATTIGTATGATTGATTVAEHRWLAVDDSLDHLVAARWRRENVPASSVVMWTDNLLGLRGLAEAGMGVAFLPCFIADPVPGLIRVPELPLLADASELWLLTHEDLRHSARIKAFMETMAESIAHDRDLLEGRRG